MGNDKKDTSGDTTKENNQEEIEEVPQREQEREDNIEIVALNLEHLAQIAELEMDAFASKRFLCLFSAHESAKEMRARYSKYPQEKLDLGAVALDTQQDQVLGFVQMTTKELPMYPPGLHSCKRGEMYIETVCVSSQARGKGIGTRLLDWCEAKARSHPGIHTLSLEVLNGNRAIGLYERYGFRGVDEIDMCCDALVVCFCFGRPYGCCHPACGSIEMTKRL